MGRDDLPEYVRLLQEAAEFGLLEDDLGQVIAQNLRLGIPDAFLERRLRGRVMRHRIRQAFVGPFPLPRLPTGEVVAGSDASGRWIRWVLQWLVAHLLIVGSSGSGKTSFCRFLALQIVPRVQGAWLIDSVKREFAVLAPLLARLDVELLVLPARSLKFNPLQVPAHVHPHDWAARIADTLVDVFDLPPRAAKLLHATILTLYRRFGVLDGARGYPTLYDLVEEIRNDEAANPQARLAVVDNITPTLLSLGPGVLAYRSGWTTEDLARRRLVLELGGLAEADKNLLLYTLVLSEFTSRVASGRSNCPMDLWVAGDEVAPLVSASARRSAVIDLIGLIRGTGVGLCVSAQTSDVHPAVMSNTAVKVVGRAGSMQDYATLGGAMGLTGEQLRWMALHLVPGQFVGQVGEGSWRHPFLFRVPPMQLPRATAASQPPSRGLGDLRMLPVQPAPRNGGPQT